MCMLSLITPEAQVSYEHLDNGARQNTDGYGYAIVRHKGYGGLLVHRGMNRFEVLDKFKQDMAANPGKYAMFHSRWATGGVKDTTNCHPFQVGNDKLTVLGHNGVFSALQPTNPADTRSDTAVFAQEVVPQRFRRLDRPGVQNQFNQAIGYNKVCILTANIKYRDDAYLFNQPAGHWVEGVWHSNTDYQGGWRSLYSYSDDYDDDGWAEWTSSETGKTYRWRRVPRRGECPICFALMSESVDLATGECQMCGFCVDCREWKDECSCLSVFNPARHGLAPLLFGSQPARPVTTLAVADFASPEKLQERLALPPGSGSATKYGDGFDGEGDDDGTTQGEPTDFSTCWYGENGWCMSRVCVYTHRLALDEDGTITTGIDGEVIEVSDVLTDMDRSILGDHPAVVSSASSLYVVD